MNLVPYVESQKYKALTYHRSLANQYFREARRVARELDFDIEIPPDFNTGDFHATPLIQIERQKANGAAPAPPRFPGIELVNCYRPWQATVVGEVGDVRPCCVYWKPMGNLRGDGFEAVWNGAKYRKLRDSINSRSDSLCYSCRLPQFDSEENRAASQLAPSLRELVVQGAERLWKRPSVRYAGVLDGHLDPGGAIAL
jgi:MoaA/NifB/PqqE/SkfB family radical SAM enzyme